MKAFIFDMDGVIVDSEPIHSRTKMETFRHYGIHFAEEELVHYMGRTTADLFRAAIEAQPREGLDITEMIAYKHRLYLDILRHDTAVQPVAGIRELFAALQQAEIPMALASSAGQAVIDAVLEAFDLRRCFQSVLSGADLPKSKPDPAVYLLSAERLGIAPADCVVLEDAASGVAAAKAAGMYCVAYRNPNSGCQDLSKADRVIAHIGELDIHTL